VNVNSLSSSAAPGSSPARERSLCFPADLRVWLRHSALLIAAQGIAQETDSNLLRATAPITGARFQHPWRMMTLVTFACAVGLHDDRAAAAFAAVDPDLRHLCREPLPGRGAIRRFRNQNQNVLMSCLGKLLRHVWCQHAGRNQAAVPPLLAIEILCEARARVQRWRAEEVTDAPRKTD
jgi:hypothetical protein